MKVNSFLWNYFEILLKAITKNKDFTTQLGKLTSFILLLFLLGCTPKKESLKVTYIANCSFLYESELSKIIIDPFGTEFGIFFYLPTPETRLNIENGKTPFNNINLVLITHIHGDHFNPFLAEKFLLRNENTKMICTPQAHKLIKDSCKQFNKIKSQIISPNLSMNTIKTMEINGISVTITKLQHGTNRSLEGLAFEDYTDYEKTENFGYLINLNDNIIFHQGDASLKINQATLNKLNKKVDVAHLSFFDWDTTSYQILKEKLNAKNIIFMHRTKPGKELETEEFKLIQPNLIFFKQELESKLFE